MVKGFNKKRCDGCGKEFNKLKKSNEKGFLCYWCYRKLPTKLKLKCIVCLKEIENPKIDRMFCDGLCASKFHKLKNDLSLSPEELRAKRRIYEKRYWAKNRERLNAYAREFYKTHKEQILTRARKWRKNKYKTDLGYREKRLELGRKAYWKKKGEKNETN